MENTFEFKNENTRLGIKDFSPSEKLDIGPYRTAIQWLKNELKSNYGDSSLCEITWEELDKLTEQAEIMDRDRIEDAFRQGRAAGIFFGDDAPSAEKYYNDMYGKK